MMCILARPDPIYAFFLIPVDVPLGRFQAVGVVRLVLVVLQTPQQQGEDEGAKLFSHSGLQQSLPGFTRAVSSWRG